MPNGDKPSISLHLVTWDSMACLSDCLASIKRQTFRNVSVVVVDNGSRDESIAYVRSHIPHAVVLRNPTNLGFAHAHNQAIALSKAKYVCVANTDLVMEDDCLERLVEAMEQDASLGSVQGKLVRWRQPGEPVIIDSTGIGVSAALDFYDRGAGIVDRGQYDGANQRDIFGATGALALYRRAALDSVSKHGEYFDKSFFAYKEDVDLAWRLQLMGWSSAYVASARATHRRTAGTERGSVTRVIAHRLTKGHRINALSYRNHLAMLYKNARIADIVFVLPMVIGYELAKLLYVVVREWQTAGALAGFVGRLPEYTRKRADIRARRRVRPAEMRRWFTWKRMSRI